MNIEQLEYIIEVTKTGSITESANHLHVSQSAVSKSIYNLEQELGVQIFYRSRSGTAPTEEGRKIIKKAFEIIEKVNELKEESKLSLTNYNDHIKISASSISYLGIPPSALSTFKMKFPNVVLEIKERSFKEIFADIKNGESEIGLIIYIDIEMDKIFKANKDLAFEKIVDGKFVVCASKNSKLAYNAYLTTEDILNEPFVVYADYNWQKFLNNYFDKDGRMKIAFSSTDNFALKKAISEGVGINLGFDFIQKYDPYMIAGLNVAIPLIDFDNVNVSLSGVYSKEKPLSKPIKELLKIINLNI
ncbi:LysR family transcriptional regulator [Neobacillus pocheonensis]|uniref:LysR family transcriptional regulator n=1 Tax=Neobacillus pocheonensis TaxID=363869 RepID=A0ABT0WD73_9BACI|nr:LysR family transcriptional regulator [Neobacillus pocheonensis]